MLWNLSQKKDLIKHCKNNNRPYIEVPHCLPAKALIPLFPWLGMPRGCVIYRKPEDGGGGALRYLEFAVGFEEPGEEALQCIGGRDKDRLFTEERGAL